MNSTRFTATGAPAALLLILALVSGCGGGGSAGGGGGGGTSPAPLDPAVVLGPAPGGAAAPDGGTPVGLTISGQVTFDRLPVTLSGLGAAPVATPAAEIVVEAVAHDDYTQVLQTGATDASGNYSLGLTTDRDFYVRARALSAASGEDAVYHSQTSPAVVYGVSGPIMNRAGGSQTADLHAEASLPELRAGAFAIHDTARKLRRQAVSLGAPAPDPLDLFWAPGNIGTSFQQIGGAPVLIQTSGFADPGPKGNASIFLPGGAAGQLENSDHDEFDESVIAHEWGHFLMTTRSRDNNFGGAHNGEELVYGASYGEGLPTAVGCVLLGTKDYIDTTGLPSGATSVAFFLDCESGVTPGTGLGYANEFINTRVAWDLLDGAAGNFADTDADPAAVAFADFHAGLAALASRQPPDLYVVAWLASLLQQLIDDGFLTQADADTLMNPWGESFPPAGGPDPWPEELVVGGSATADSLDAWSGADPNPELGPQANGVWRLTLAAPATVVIQLTQTTAAYTASSHRLNLYVFDLDRNEIGAFTGDAADKSLNLNLAAGTYIVRVRHAPDSEALSAPASFTLEAQ